MSASIFCCARSWIACINNAGAKNKRVLGFVDLNPRQYFINLEPIVGVPQDGVLDTVTVLIEQGFEPR